jgi:hypothetical protein
VFIIIQIVESIILELKACVDWTMKYGAHCAEFRRVIYRQVRNCSTKEEPFTLMRPARSHFAPSDKNIVAQE